MQTITAKVETKLKRQPVDSTQLQPSEILVVPSGKSYGIVSKESAKNGHTKVTLAANSGTFYAFTKHWEGLNGGNSPFSGNKGIIHNELMRYGFSLAQCAAILGCVQQESSFNPYAQEGPPPKGLGLFQWSYDRRDKVPAFTKSVATDIHNQVNLFVKELKGSEKPAGDKLFSAGTLDAAMKAMQDFERFGIAGNRQQYAERIYAELTKH